MGRPEWAHILASEYCPSKGDNSVWRLSTTLEKFLEDYVDKSDLEKGLKEKGPGARYKDTDWQLPFYPNYYLGFYTPMYVATLQRALLGLAPSRTCEGMAVLDVGVGMGTTGIAIADLLNTAEARNLKPPSISCFFVDRDRRKLSLARGMIGAFKDYLGPASARIVEAWLDPENWVCFDVTELENARLKDTRFDLIVLGNIVREIESRYLIGAEQKRVRPRLAAFARRRLAPGGLVLNHEHGYDSGGARVCRSACGFWQACRKAELESIVPALNHKCVYASEECAWDDGCKSGHRFTFIWPHFLTRVPGWKANEDGSPQWRRTVRSVWVAARKAPEAHQIRLETADIPVRFEVGRVYRNSLYEYEVLEVLTTPEERIRARRLDTGKEVLLVASIAAHAHLKEAEPEGGR